MSKTEIRVNYYPNGKRKSEGTLKDGLPDGLFTEWYENGQKRYEGTWKDGKLNGLVTRWYNNRQKEREGTFKDGEVISSKCWDWNGNEIDCPSEDVIQYYEDEEPDEN